MNLERTNLTDIRIGEEISPIDTVVDGFKTYQVVHSALRLGLFDWLEEHGPAHREEIGEALSINGMFTRSFLQVLTEHGFLSADKDRFANTNTATALLVRKSPAYQGDWIVNAADEHGKWKMLQETLSSDAANKTGFSDGPSPEFLKALGQRSLRGEIQGVTALLTAWEGFGSAKRLLDLGGGHGLYAIAACQQNPALAAVVFDKPHVIDLTKEFINDYGLDNRIQVMGGDILRDDPGSGYDIVIVSHLLYKFRADLPSIFGKVASALNPKGLFVSNHWFCGPVCGEGSSGVSELDRSIHSYGHPLCHPEEFEAALVENGLVVTRNTTVPSNFGSSHVHIAERTPEGCSQSSRPDEPCGCRSCR